MDLPRTEHLGVFGNVWFDEFLSQYTGVLFNLVEMFGFKMR